jgi:hypothetical protein
MESLYASAYEAIPLALQLVRRRDISCLLSSESEMRSMSSNSGPSKTLKA